MVQFANKRLQVFISSTYSDLIEERQAAVEAILVAGHIPAGMELFTAGDEGQMEVIKQWIDESDVYLLILGGRYGSIEPKSGKSYSHLEYEYACSRNIPLFACVINESMLESKVNKIGLAAVEQHEPAKLREFRSLVLTKLVRFWDDSKDIKITVGETMAHFSRREDMRGWVKSPPDVDVGVIAAELSRLSRENARLQAAVSTSPQQPIIAGLQYSDLKELLARKELLKLFMSLKRAKGERTFHLGDRTAIELEYIGLVSPDFAGDYTLTEAGKLLLAKLELDKLRDQDNQDE